MFIVFYTLIELSIGIRVGTLLLISLAKCDLDPLCYLPWIVLYIPLCMF